MNGEQWAQLDKRLREIEANSATTAEHISNLDERFDKIEGFVDEIRIERAKEEGAEEESAKHAASSGRKAGMLSGGVIGGIIVAIKALFE